MRIYNATDNNIIDYRIETPKLINDEGEVLVQGKTETNYPKSFEDNPPPVRGMYSHTIWDNNKVKRSKLFSIKAGQEVELPNYAAEILLQRYSFLRKV